MDRPTHTIMAVADALLPNWRQAISSHHTDSTWLRLPARWTSASLTTVSNVSTGFIHVIMQYCVILDWILLENNLLEAWWGATRKSVDCCVLYYWRVRLLATTMLCVNPWFENYVRIYGWLIRCDYCICLSDYTNIRTYELRDFV